MRLASVLMGDQRRAAAVFPDEEYVALLPEGVAVDDIVRGGSDALGALDATIAEAPRLSLGEVQLLAPLTRFNRDILCTGWNYWDHFEESKGKREGQDPPEPPAHPTFFTKGPDTVIGPYDGIAFDPEISSKWDYEAEVAIIIGKDGRSIPEDQAREHIFGYCVANDVSQRDLQRQHGGQWLKGKSIDQTMPLGPWITTADEIEDPYSLDIEFELDGRLMQKASTSQVAFSFERIISELSWGMTLRAGDVILTGTPSGIGNAREPQIFLEAGSELVSTVSQLGTLRNQMSPTKLS
ncbi:fumarylacetoacetate hydrolase family protein [Nocardioides luteus]|uniref:fumarylacetoacetate hydrolase family protein n=1 Tax=Nocardioides luteus TaxID=1844 RepID=UPI001A30F41B|nr:fumarylacetoacetate hydrolase family protein [Nocardioides luteus]MBG6096831.1 2-keto-4-pentenoate hydratase/2-oxohepta-3-ene-1,7-dioic acid hydratase in catechol pathway [Nocardioides luteus]